MGSRRDLSSTPLASVAQLPDKFPAADRLLFIPKAPCGMYSIHTPYTSRRRGAKGEALWDAWRVIFSSGLAYSGNGPIKGVILKDHQETCAWEVYELRHQVREPSWISHHVTCALQ